MTGPEPDPGDKLRASDADRQTIVDQLQAAFSEGRLDLTELDERTASAYAAKTMGDLKELTRDLPPPGTRAELPASAQPAPPAKAPDDFVDRMKAGVAALPPWVMPVVGVIVAMNVAGWIVASAVGGGHVVFPWWIILIVIWVVGGRAHKQQQREQRIRMRDEQRLRQEERRQQWQQRRADNEWYDRYHRRSRGYYDRRYQDEDDD
jgi:hypothetical protein